jgi:hypothetical protein
MASNINPLPASGIYIIGQIVELPTRTNAKDNNICLDGA